MSSLAERLAEHGIKVGAPPHGIPNLSPGEKYQTCPKCSANRKNKNAACLSVKIDEHGGAVWTCHHCPWKGNIPSHGGRPAEALRQPPKPAKQPPKVLTPNEGMIKWFLEKRGITQGTLERAGVYFGKGWFPQLQEARPAIVFPYRRAGVVVNNKYRSQDKLFAQDAKALKALYNYDGIGAPGPGMDTLIWCEGEVDVMSVLEAGIDTVTSLPDGAPAKHKDEIDQADKRFQPLRDAAEILAPIKKHVLFTDNDPPGEALAYQLAHRLGLERCYRAVFPEGCKDANEILLRHGVAGVKRAIIEARGYPIEGIIEVQPGDMVKFRSSPRIAMYGIGVKELDKQLRYRPGQLVIVSGTPTSGKTEIVDWVMTRLSSQHGWRWGVCSMEHDWDEHCAKLCEKHAGLPFYNYGPTTVAMPDSDLMSAEAWVRRHFYFVRKRNDEEPITIDFILEKLRVLHLRYGINGAVIDPYNQIAHQRKGMTEPEYVPIFLARLKAFAQAHKMMLFLIAHPRKMERNPKTGKRYVPTLHDIAGSIGFWTAADIGIVTDRPSFDTNDVDFIIQKVKRKDQGRERIVRLRWDKSTGRYAYVPHEDEHPKKNGSVPSNEPPPAEPDMDDLYQDSQTEIPFD